MKNMMTVFFMMLLVDAGAQSLPGMYYSDSGMLGRPMAKDPNVIYFKGQYFMYYSLPGREMKNWYIGIAAGKDLHHWKKLAVLEPAADYEKNGLCAPGAVVRKDTLHLFYQTYGNGPRDAICHAWSTDGIHFTRNASNPVFRPSGAWTCGRAIDAEVIAFNGKYFLYYATRDSAMQYQQQGVAVTSLNTHFNKDEWTNLSVDSAILFPVLPWETKCIEGASCVVIGKTMYMFYAGGYNNDPQQIGVAKTSDGFHWQRLSNTPFLPNGTPGSWNSSESGHPDIVKDESGRYFLFYQGNNDKGKTWFLSRRSVQWRNGLPVLGNE